MEIIEVDEEATVGMIIITVGVSSIMIEVSKTIVEVAEILEAEVASVGVMMAATSRRGVSVAKVADIIKTADSPSDVVDEADIWIEVDEADIEERSKVVITSEEVAVGIWEVAREATASNKTTTEVPVEWAEEEQQAHSIRTSSTQ